MAEVVTTTCCIVGGGPAGMMLGLLLARSGVKVTVLEKHGDFLRDFRGDTIHASTLELMHELGLLDEFLKLPHQRIEQPKIWIDGLEFDGPNFGVLPTKCKFIALMPQWDFLNFLAAKVGRYPAFTLLQNTRACQLIEDKDRVIGVKAIRKRADDASEEVIDIRADLVVGCDGRRSTVRELSKLQLVELGVPIDVLWFRVSAGGGDFKPSLGRIKDGKMLVTLPRGDYYQCAYVIRKDAFDGIKAAGLAEFQRTVVDIAPYLANVTRDVLDWQKVFLLSVQINRLKTWHQPGLLCIGDAAHAMSPVGGIGINLAIQDAVATANAIAEKLAQRSVTDDDLAAIQRRREWAVWATQAMQQQAHKQIEQARTLSPLALPWIVRKLIALFAPVLRWLGARFVGMGLRPEHVKTLPRS